MASDIATVCFGLAMVLRPRGVSEPPPMRLITFINTERCGEVEGAFENGELIDTWCCNDAHWRGAYFAGLLEHMDFEEVDPETDEERERLEDILVAHWGGDEDEDYEEEDEE